MCRLGLHDYPYELAEVPASMLREEFSTDLQRLIANLAWPCRYRRQGTPVLYDTDQRGFGYRPLQAVLQRGGFFSNRLPPPAATSPVPSQHRQSGVLADDPTLSPSAYPKIDRGDPTAFFYLPLRDRRHRHAP